MQQWIKQNAGLVKFAIVVEGAHTLSYTAKEMLVRAVETERTVGGLRWKMKLWAQKGVVTLGILIITDFWTPW